MHPYLPVLPEDQAILSQEPSQMEGDEYYWQYCAPCNTHFSAERSFIRHLRQTAAHAQSRQYKCSKCHREFYREDVRRRHELGGRCQLQPLGCSSESTVPAKRGYPDIVAGSDEEDHDGRWPKLNIRMCPAGLEHSVPDGNLGQSYRHLNDSIAEDNHGILHYASRLSDASERFTGEAEASELSRWAAADIPSDVDTDCNGRYSIGWSNVQLDPPITVPEFSRGNKATSQSNKSNTSLQGGDATSVAGIPAHIRHTGVFDLRDELSLDKLPTLRPGKTLNRANGRCTICKREYEKNVIALRAHLYRHLHDLKQRGHPCEQCGIAFAHEADLDYHLRAAAKGHCGFAFMHNNDCTGHHPPQDSDQSLEFSDHDRCKLGLLLQEWEQSQLKVHQSSIQGLVSLPALNIRFSGLSTQSSPVRRSITSLVYSLKSFHSEHHDTNSNAKLKDIENRFASLGLGRASSLIGRLKKYKETKTANKALQDAAACGDVVEVKTLLRQRWNIDTRDRYSTHSSDLTSLVVGGKSRHLQTTTYLMDYEASINTEDDHGETALLKACSNGHTEVARVLLAYNANINSKGNSPWEMLHIAKDPKWNKVWVTFLETLQFGVVNKSRSPCDPWRRTLSDISSNLLIPTLKFLLAQNAILGPRYLPKSLTVNHHSMLPMRGLYGDFIYVLIECGASVTARINLCVEGPTVLYLAAAGGALPLVRLLLTKNVDVNALVHGETALCAAARQGHLEIVRLLLDARANPIMHDRSVTRVGCEECFPSETVSCALKEAVFGDNYSHVIGMLSASPESNERITHLDHFGALFLAIAQGSAAIVRAILKSPQWMIPESVVTALLEIVVTAGSAYASNNSPLHWGPWRCLVLQDISDALIEAGAILRHDLAAELRNTIEASGIPT